MFGRTFDAILINHLHAPEVSGGGRRTSGRVRCSLLAPRTAVLRVRHKFSIRRARFAPRKIFGPDGTIWRPAAAVGFAGRPNGHAPGVPHRELTAPPRADLATAKALGLQLARGAARDSGSGGRIEGCLLQMRDSVLRTSQPLLNR